MDVSTAVQEGIGAEKRTYDCLRGGPEGKRRKMRTEERSERQLYV